MSQSSEEAKPSKETLSVNPNFSNAHIYSPATAYGDLVFLAGKTSWIAPDPEDVRAATRYLLDSIEKELTHAGSSMEKVLKVVVYLRDMADYDAVNEIYIGRFGTQPPARTTVEAKLPRNSLVGIDVTAYR